VVDVDVTRVVLVLALVLDVVGAVLVVAGVDELEHAARVRAPGPRTRPTIHALPLIPHSDPRRDSPVACRPETLLPTSPGNGYLPGGGGGGRQADPGWSGASGASGASTAVACRH
jgi:hypothetical protein